VVDGGHTNPQGLNKLANAQNNPIRYNDPSGRCAILCTAAIGAGIGFFGDLAWQAGTQLFAGKSLDQVEINWGQTAAATVAGFVGGATLGLGTAAASAVGFTGATASATVFGYAATGATLGGQIGAGIGGNINAALKSSSVQKEAAELGFGDRGKMALDAVAAVTGIAVGNTIQKAATQRLARQYISAGRVGINTGRNAVNVSDGSLYKYYYYGVPLSKSTLSREAAAVLRNLSSSDMRKFSNIALGLGQAFATTTADEYGRCRKIKCTK
jgi:hypothetical protein